MTDCTILPSLLDYWHKDVIAGSGYQAELLHLDDETCYLLSLPNALHEAPAKTVAHLSSCPMCMQKWSDWLAVKNLSEEQDGESDLFLSYGLLEAAAGRKRVDGISSKSVCGNFKLSIFPKQGDLDCAMITVEYLAENHACVEGHRFKVLEGDGKVIADGQFRHGRLARTTNEFQQINLDRWTIIEEQCHPEDPTK